MAGVPFNPMYASQLNGLVDSSHAAAKAAQDPLLSLYLANTYGYRPPEAKPDYGGPNWVPDYSKEGVQAMRSRLRDLGDVPYQDLSDEQHAESRRLSAALREIDNLKFDLGETVLLAAPPIGVHQPSFGDIADAFQMGAHNGMTMGLGDEINAGLQTPFRIAGQAIDGDLIDLGKAYSDSLAYTRAYMDERTRKVPAAAFVGELVGGLLFGKGSPK
jgi:hypothetical protein